MKGKFVVAVVVMMVGLAAVVLTLLPQTVSAAKGERNTSLPSKATASEISNAFKRNDAAVDEKFAKRQLDVVAEVNCIIRVRDMSQAYQKPEEWMTVEVAKHEYVVEVNVTGYDTVLFFFTADQRKELAKICPPDQTITIRGYCEGDWHGGGSPPRHFTEVHFYNCMIVGNKPSTKELDNRLGLLEGKEKVMRRGNVGLVADDNFRVNIPGGVIRVPMLGPAPKQEQEATKREQILLSFYLGFWGQ